MKYFLEDLKDEVNYWVLGRPTYGYYRISVSERWDYLKCIVSNRFCRVFLCPMGKHYVKFNSGDPLCIICRKRYTEIYK